MMMRMWRGSSGRPARDGRWVGVSEHASHEKNGRESKQTVRCADVLVSQRSGGRRAVLRSGWARYPGRGARPPGSPPLLLDTTSVELGDATGVGDCAAPEDGDVPARPAQVDRPSRPVARWSTSSRRMLPHRHPRPPRRLGAHSLVSSCRRSSVSWGITIRISCPSLLGVSPRSEQLNGLLDGRMELRS